jgi:hypothetical protein
MQVSKGFSWSLLQFFFHDRKRVVKLLVCGFFNDRKCSIEPAVGRCSMVWQGFEFCNFGLLDQVLTEECTARFGAA